MSGITYTATLTPDSAAADSTNKISVGNRWNFVGSAPESGNKPVVFVSEVGVDTIGNNIFKTAAAGWNAGTFSDQVITADGSVSTTVAETNTDRMIGLSDSDTNVSFTRLITRFI